MTVGQQKFLKRWFLPRATSSEATAWPSPLDAPATMASCKFLFSKFVEADSEYLNRTHLTSQIVPELTVAHGRR